MKYTLIFSMVFILLFSCRKDEVQISTCENCSFSCLDINQPVVISNECIENWNCSFKTMPKSKIEISQFYGIIPGDNNVFQMINSTEGEINIADDEFTHILVFELDDSQTSFSIDDSQLDDMNVYFRRLCKCSESDFKRVTSGCIQGEKQSDGSWFIQGNLVVNYTKLDLELKFDAQFHN